MTEVDYSPIEAALSSHSYDELYYRRLFHGRGKTFAGLEQITIDWYPPALFICLFRPVDEDWLDGLVERLWQSRHSKVASIVVQHRQGAKTQAQLVKGEALPTPHVVKEHDVSTTIDSGLFKDTHNLIQDTHTFCGPGKGSEMELEDETYDGFSFQVQLSNAQNVGIFPDMINGRSWVKQNACGVNVLNLFSYTCLFSVAAMQGGAQAVVNVDMNKSVMAQGQKNHRFNEIDKSKVKFLTHNIFNSWAKIKRLGPYGLIIIDPPSFQKGSFVLTKDYQRLIRRLPELAESNAKVMLCLNSPDLGPDYLLELVADICPELKFIARLPNHPDFPELDQDKSLKVLLFEF